VALDARLHKVIKVEAVRQDVDLTEFVNEIVRKGLGRRLKATTRVNSGKRKRQLDQRRIKGERNGAD